MIILENEIMKNYSNMRVGGRAEKVILFDNKLEIKKFLENTKIDKDKLFILGNGTNVLFGDSFINKIFICTKNLKNIKAINNNRLEVEAGATIKNMLDIMKNYNLSGIESLTGIPGTIGGLIYMNGGAFGTEIFDFIESVEILDENLNITNLKKNEIDFSYRYSEFQKRNVIILSAIFKLNNNFDENRVKEIKSEREAKHPLDRPSLGSTFKNPNGDFAARLISECDLKNYNIGGAIISSKHPNFILNLGNATCSDIENIISFVKNEVNKKFNVQLNEEIIIVK